MIDLQIAETISPGEIPALQEVEYLEQAARSALQHTGAPSNAELTVVITDDEQLRRLNQQFLGIDAPTDVLSFPSGGGEPDPDSGDPYLGDILISYPRALVQAEAGGHPVRQELQLLVVHGVLHLMGYDHAGEGEKAEMWAVQAAILNSLGSTLRPPD
jgi:probable rRNA maturation factor